MKFRSVEDRIYPTLGLSLQAGEVVELPDDTEVAGLEAISEPTKASKVEPVEAPSEKVGE